MTLLDDLKAARAVIAEDDHWTQGRMAVTPEGEEVEASDPRACAWCAVGAVRRITGIRDDRYLSALDALMPPEGQGETYDAEDEVIEFNDGVDVMGTGHADVLAMFDRAIERASRP